MRIIFFALCSTSAAEPGKPAVEPQCGDTAKGSITLSWELPTDDGGKPIKGYVVEKREHGSDKWTKYVSPLNTSTLHVNLSVRLSLKHVAFAKISQVPCRFTLIMAPRTHQVISLLSWDAYTRTMPRQDVCLSVCPSVTRRLYISPVSPVSLEGSQTLMRGLL